MNHEELPARIIENVTIEHNPHRLRRIGHTLLPNLIQPPEVSHNGIVNNGDSLRFGNGKKIKIDKVIRSSEGVRYAFSDIPLPSDE